MCDENGNHYLGGHDVSLDLSTLTLKNLCVPFGVAIPSNEPQYEDVMEENGTKSTYLVSDIVLWIGRYPELAEAIYSEDVYFGQSMELLYSFSEPLKEDPTYTDIVDFSFDALCLLNKSDDPKFNVKPCFPNASVRPITYSINKNEFTLLMNEMKEQLSFCMNNTDKNQGGNILDVKNVILQKYNKTIEDLDFSIDNLSDDEFETKMNELFGEKEVEPVVFSATYNQKREILSNAFSPIIVKDEIGNHVEETYFWVSDFDDTYVFVEINHWTANDYTSKYGRYSYTFDDVTLTATVSDDFEEMIRVWLTLDEKAKLDEDRVNFEIISTEFSNYQADHSYTNSEYKILKEFEEQVNTEKRNAEENAVFAKFEKRIGKTAEFTTLKENSKDFSIEDLTKECLCIVGHYTIVEDVNDEASESNSKPATGIKFSLEQQTDEEEPYGGLMKKYLNK